MRNNANLALRVMWPLYQESMCHCGEAISNTRGLGSSSQGASPFVMRDRCQREFKVCNQLLRLILNFCELYKLSHQGMGRLAFQGSSSTFYTSQNN